MAPWQNTQFSLHWKCAIFWLKPTHSIFSTIRLCYKPGKGGWCACKLDKMLPWESWPVCNHPNWRQPPAPALIKIQKAARLSILASPGNLWTLLRALCHPKAPVTDDIISIVRVTWELVAGTHTIQTHYIIWLERCAYHLFFLLSKTKPISSWRNHLLDCHVGFLRLPILAAVKFHKIQ